MSESKKAKFLKTLKEGLSLANRGNIYWTKKDAMQSLAMFHNYTRRA